jgi:hypothetical protein
MSDFFQRGSWGNLHGWLFLGVMIALLAGIDYVLPPDRADMFMISAASWGWVVVLGGLVLGRGRSWRWIDLFRERD